MKLIALILGLAIGHAATRRLKLRELRWFDPYFDFALARSGGRSRPVAVALVLVFLAIVVLPVLWVSIVLQRTFIPWDLPYLLFAVFIVFLCLGPRDLGSEIEDYCAALDRGEHDEARRVLTELSESRSASTGSAELVEDAVFAQATNRIFGVTFWFVVLGPVGAWLFRVSDLLRRRAAFEAARHTPKAEAALPAIEIVHGALALIPARLAALGYALAGSFDDAIDCWRGLGRPEGRPLHEGNARIVAAVGKAAMTGYLEQPANSSAAARNSLRLVMRTLFIWVTVIALMTLFGWAV
ncbi:MAG: regulatory signaling modulator protein AmpE [Gammaproteobacteria bacterium]|nr:regulatory signaling modulator protein AmpE [Gammaproteobacteria bacterium]